MTMTHPLATGIAVPSHTSMPLPSGVTVEHLLVTPAVAAEMLAHNTHNRNQKPVYQSRYRADMAAGSWTWTGEPIRFDLTGRLLDGQNRLQALIDAGVSLPFLVIRGLPAEAQDDMDTGAPRQFGDVLQLRGEANANELAAITRRVAAWNLGHRRSLRGVVLSYHALSRVLDENPGLRDVINPARKVRHSIGLPTACGGLLLWVTSNIDAEDAAFFFDRLADGQMLTSGDPIYELRRTVERVKSVRGESNETFLSAVTIKAWNAYRRGDKVSLLKFSPGGAKPEKFPEPV